MKNDTLKLPYEIHVTVSDSDKKTNNKHQNLFIEICKQKLKVKPIIIDIETNNRKKQYMTSSIILGDDDEAFKEMKRISQGFNNTRFNVVREKIETVPWHKKAPSILNNTNMPQNCYFECHFTLKLIPDEIKLLDELLNLDTELKQLNLHKSKNILKKHTDGKITQMLTYRVFDGVLETFKKQTQNIEQILMKSFSLNEKSNIEFSIYDSNIQYDHLWLENKIRL